MEERIKVITMQSEIALRAEQFSYTAMFYCETGVPNDFSTTCLNKK
jgi:hypothetical protein